MVSLKFDSDGYLLSLHDWDENIAAEIAAGENLKLTPEHWEVITLTRQFYEQHQLSPATRALVSFIKRELGIDKGNSRYLMKLFKGQPARLVNKIAGLPKPDNCI